MDGDLPLLFSRQSLKEFGVQLDIENDIIRIKGQPQDLTVTNSGHYVADLLEETCEEILHASLESSDPKKVALRLHRYYGHPRSGRLVETVKNSDLNDKELIKEIVKLDESCDHCKVYKRDTSKPKSSLLTSNDFNQIVSMDLKKLSTGHLMLHCIDLFAKFSATCIIPNKEKETIIQALFKIWISIYGASGEFFSDNGGEFVNHEFTDMCQSLGINVKTTAGNSPWSNGVCERHNGLIGETYDKILEDFNCDPHIALAWATNAKNSLSNSFGYTPYTLVFGKNPNLPGVDNVRSITVLNETAVSQILADHLNAMYTSRLAYMKANNSNKLKRALLGRIPNVETEYFANDKVYFKKAKQKKWSGPATVIGKDGKAVFIMQGGSLFRVHASKVTLQSRADEAVERSAQEEVGVEDSEPVV